MKFVPLVLGAACLLSPELARATTVYDSVDVNPLSFNAGWDWIDPTQDGPNASQFSVADAQTLTSVSLELSAYSPSDGGSISVVLMLDNNGNPPYSKISDPSASYGKLSSFSNTTVLGTIQDSSLSQNPALITVDTDATIGAGTYWIGLETSLLPGQTDPLAGTYGSGQWWWTNVDGSVALTNNFNTIGYPGSFAVGGDNPGAYELIINASDPATIDTPEPATFTILGGGIAGLGYFRRRKAKRT